MDGVSKSVFLAGLLRKHQRAALQGRAPPFPLLRLKAKVEPLITLGDSGNLSSSIRSAHSDAGDFGSQGRCCVFVNNTHTVDYGQIS